MNKNDVSSGLFFEFHQWKECFRSWRENIALHGDTLQLIASSNFFTAGYWIEKKGNDVFRDDIQYVGDEVFELEKRIIHEIESAKKENRHTNLVF